MRDKLSSPAWAMLEYGWYPLLVFIATPYLLYTLGPEKYGHWMLLTATVGFGTVLNIGTGAATIKQISSDRGLASGGNVEGVVRISLAIALVGGCLMAVLILGVFWLAGDVLFEKMGDRSLVHLTGTVSGLLVWIEQIDNVFASALKGAERFGRAARVEIASKTVQILAAVLVVAVWGSVAALYVALTLVAVVRLVAKVWMVRGSLAVLSLRPSFSNAAHILHYAKWGWLQGAGGLFFGIADRMLVGSLLGAASLAHYSVATQLAQQIHAIPAAGLSVIFPKVSRKLEGEANFSLCRITRLAMVGNFFASGALALTLLIFGRQILSLWLGEALDESSVDVLWYLTIAYWFLAINIVPHYILLGVGRFRFVAMSNLVAGMISLIAMFVLAHSHGLMGVRVARIVYGVITLVNFLPLIEFLRSAHGEFAAKNSTISSGEGGSKLFTGNKG